MKPLVRIGHLIDQHPSLYKQYKNTSEAVEYTQCTGCPTCDQIDQLSIANGLKSISNKGKIAKPRKKQKVVQVDKSKPSRTITQEEMKELLDKGMTVSEISKEKNIGMSSLYNKLNKWFPDYRKRPNSSKFPLTQEEVLKLWDEGKLKKRNCQIGRGKHECPQILVK